MYYFANAGIGLQTFAGFLCYPAKHEKRFVLTKLREWPLVNIYNKSVGPKKLPAGLPAEGMVGKLAMTLVLI